MKSSVIFRIGVLAITCTLAAGTIASAQFHGHPEGNADYPKLNYDSLYAAATPLADSPEGQAALANTIAAYGGADHLAALKGYRATWALTSAIYKEASTLTKSVASDRRHRIHLQRSDHYQTRILNGRQAWFQNPDTVIALDSMRYKAEIFSYLVLSLPGDIETEPFSGRRFGTRTDDPLQYLYLDKTDSLLLVVGVDPSDYTIRVVEGVVRQGKQHMIFVNKFSDYKKVDGYLFAHHLENISMGLKVGEAALEDLEVNPDFPPSEFRPTSN